MAAPLIDARRRTMSQTLRGASNMAGYVPQS